ncbi:unnamed protein product [Caenorhabditis nigoni]
MEGSKEAIIALIHQQLKRLKEFDDYYAEEKEEIHMRKAKQVWKRVERCNLTRDQRITHYKRIVDHIQKIIDLPAPVDDYARMSVSEMFKRAESVQKRAAELDKLNEVVVVKKKKKKEKQPTESVGNRVKTTVAGIFESMKKRIGRK